MTIEHPFNPAELERAAQKYWTDNKICDYKKIHESGGRKGSNKAVKMIIQEGKRRGLDCGVKGNNKTVVASKIMSKDKNKLNYNLIKYNINKDIKVLLQDKFFLP